MSVVREETQGWLRRMADDGPPLPVVVVVFVLLQILSFGLGTPIIGLAITAIGFVLWVSLDFRRWQRTGMHRDEGAVQVFRGRTEPRGDPRERPKRMV